MLHNHRARYLGVVRKFSNVARHWATTLSKGVILSVKKSECFVIIIIILLLDIFSGLINQCGFLDQLPK